MKKFSLNFKRDLKTLMNDEKNQIINNQMIETLKIILNMLKFLEFIL